MDTYQCYSLHTGNRDVPLMSPLACSTSRNHNSCEGHKRHLCLPQQLVGASQERTPTPAKIKASGLELDFTLLRRSPDRSLTVLKVHSLEKMCFGENSRHNSNVHPLGRLQHLLTIVYALIGIQIGLVPTRTSCGSELMCILINPIPSRWGHGSGVISKIASIAKER